MHRDRVFGYSLFELLVTIGIAVLVLSLGLPSFGSLVAEHRLRVEVDALFHAMHLARKESIMRRRVVTLCPSRDGLSCVPGDDWSHGWIMFVNLDRDLPAARDPGEPVLRAHAASSHNQVFANRQSFSFRATQLRATNGTLLFCDKARRAAPRALVVSHTGRARVSRTDSRGRPRACPDYVKLMSPL